MFSQTCVILFTGGGCLLSACWDATPLEQTPPQEQTPPAGADTPQADTPQEQTTPGADTPPPQSMLGDTVNAQAVRILLECNLVETLILIWRICLVSWV